MKKKTSIFDGKRNVLIHIGDLATLFSFGKDKNSDVPCKITVKQRDDWKAVLKEFARVQAEMFAAVTPNDDPAIKTIKRKRK